MKSDYAYLAAFDLDKTILSLNSSRLIVSAARKNGLMSRPQLYQAAAFSFIYKFDLMEPTRIVNAMMGWLKGVNLEEVIQMNKQWILPGLIECIRPEMKKEIEYHKEQNAKVIILSSALPYLCEPVCAHLNMDDVVCSRLEVENGTFSGKSIGPLVYKKEKKTRLVDYCRQQNFDMDTTWYYGDAFTDRFILKAVGNAVCVQPEIKLKLLAKKQGWKILNLEK